jgi:HlyD family secretion protein
MQLKQLFPWKLWATVTLAAFLGTAGYVAYLSLGSSTPEVQANEKRHVTVDEETGHEEPPPIVAVTVIQPRKGAMVRTTTQPGSVQAFESVDLYSKVPGFLKSQSVDIGAQVKKGQLLAVVDVPELEKQVERNQASLAQAGSKVLQMKARVTSARAELEAANAAVKQTEANAMSSAAWVRFRKLQHQRMKDLFATRSIEEKLVDESKERYEASVQTEQASVAAVSTSKARVSSCAAKIEETQADVAVAESEVKVAKAELEKSEVLLSFATLSAPFDGVITHRSFFPGDFIRAATESTHTPLLTVQRTDLMRVIVQVPDRDVILCDPGDPATLEIDALPGQKFYAKVSRIAQSQDPQTRLMRVEIDLPNPTGKIRNGMYGRATILLDKAADKFSVPTTCLVNKSEDGSKGTVYTVKSGHAHLTEVRLGEDDGLRVAVVSGVGAGDQVILRPGSALADGAEVTATFWDEAPPKQ